VTSTCSLAAKPSNDAIELEPGPPEVGSRVIEGITVKVADETSPELCPSELTV
jgi:hypothetical protein